MWGYEFQCLSLLIVNAGFCVIFVDTPVSEALKRNKQRPPDQCIPDDIILNMASRFEPPAFSKFPWEKYSLVIPADSQFEM